MCRASSSGTVAVGISASGSWLIGALDGVMVSSWNPVRAPRLRATTRSVMPNALNHTPARRPVPCASLSATSGAAIPAVMSPKPAGRVNSAGRWPAAADDHQPARWHFRLDGADYLAESDGHRWSLTTKAPTAPADVTITATTQALAAFIFAGAEADIDITGETGPVQRFRQLIGTMATVVHPA